MNGLLPWETVEKLDKDLGEYALALVRSCLVSPSELFEAATPEIIDHIDDLIMEDTRLKVPESVYAIGISCEPIFFTHVWA